MTTMKSLLANTRSRARRAGVACFVHGVLVAAAVLVAAGGAFADEPLRLDLLRDGEDLAALAGVGDCVRGRLFLVRSFDAAAASRRVWVADVLETTSVPGGAIPSGQYAGLVREHGEGGWRIELTEVDAVLGASKDGSDDSRAHRVLLGRRPDGPRSDACLSSEERLEDRSAIVARLRHLAASPAGARPIEVRVQP